MTMPGRRIGIEALNVYGGVAQIPVDVLFAHRGLRADRYANLMMRQRAVALPFEDPVTNAVNACQPLIAELDSAARGRIEMVVTATESGLDLSKSLASYLTEYLGLGPSCRCAEIKQACYAATAGLQLAAGYLASGVAPGAKVLLVATDVALVDENADYAEPATGMGAVAMLVSELPRVLTLDLGAFGLHSFEIMDTARPGPEADVVDVDRSLVAYLTCLVRSFQDYGARVADVDAVATFDFLAMHTPFAGMVRAGHRKLMRECSGLTGRQIDDDFAARVAPSLEYPAVVGNLFAGSLYLALASLIDHAELTGPARVGLYSYGSGCSAEFFSGVVDEESQAALKVMRIGDYLQGRCELQFGEYQDLVRQTRRCLVPVRERQVDPADYAGLISRATLRRPVLALRQIDNHHRSYEWI